MSREQLKNKEKAEEDLHIRITPEGKNFLWEKAKERGINLSTYVKQKLFTEEDQRLYNMEVSQNIYQITDILVNQMKLYCDDEKFINECERSAIELWHCLK